MEEDGIAVKVELLERCDGSSVQDLRGKDKLSETILSAW